MTGGTADQPAKNIAPSLIAGHNTVRHQKCCRTNMIGNETDGYIIHSVNLITFSRHLADFIPDSLHRINIKYRIHILHHNCQTLQSHASINILLGKLRVSTLSVTLKLGKYVIPYLHKAVAVTSHLTVRLSAAVFFTSVVVDFRTGSTGTSTMLPEIITLSGFRITVKPGNPLCRHANLFRPDIESLIVLPVN